MTAFEKGSHVSYANCANCGIPYAFGEMIKDDAALALQTPQAVHERINIDAHISTEVAKIDW